MSELPAIVADHLAAAWAPGDGVYEYEPIVRYNIMGGELDPIQPGPNDSSHTFRMAFTFHDDAFYNGGMYVIYWLFKFANSDGPIATMHQINGNDAPSVFTKCGDTLYITELKFNPDPLWPMPHARQPDPQTPLIINKQRTESISEMLGHISFMADGGG